MYIKYFLSLFFIVSLSGCYVVPYHGEFVGDEVYGYPYTYNAGYYEYYHPRTRVVVHRSKTVLVRPSHGHRDHWGRPPHDSTHRDRRYEESRSSGQATRFRRETPHDPRGRAGWSGESKSTSPRVPHTPPVTQERANPKDVVRERGGDRESTERFHR